MSEMSDHPLLPANQRIPSNDPANMVIIEVGLPGDTWRYCIERHRLAEKSEWFRAMLLGQLAPEASNPPPTLQLQYVEKRAFDHLLRYLHDEPVNFQSVSTARATLDAAHQYLWPELARLSVEFLERNLNPGTVLKVFRGLNYYAEEGGSRVLDEPSAPPSPGDDAGEIARLCTRLLLSCLAVIDQDPEAILGQERFEELTALEVEEIARRDSLRLPRENLLFAALERWAAAECRRQGRDPTAANKRAALQDEVWFSVRYPLMTDKEFVEGPMASGILTIEESTYIVAKILGHRRDGGADLLRSPDARALSRLSSVARAGVANAVDLQDPRMSKPGKREREDNKRNRRKECANQGHRACARIGDCLIRVLACVFD
ncbi:BTB/POZ domain-containing protein 6-B [Orussus abietinus]|uniref:BTB/POZ domain-containing protein 6-B n=1 Tax=Orussus abietinus TaxID=222816 RepID=UPI000626D022|nr:BTB/POZ domain-containing protein 6-B [Orussus abietinus]XP_012284402.1 BTB/POZ domain-containing protein 6-B [Orussus abietinus]XP_012284403.1 BTB/POZ domain-containing protein 6-B [Orussus abietinus]